MTRQPKTAHQRATEALGVAERKVKRIGENLAKAKDTVKALERELLDAEARRDYIKDDPALQQESLTGTEPVEPAK